MSPPAPMRVLALVLPFALASCAPQGSKPLDAALATFYRGHVDSAAVAFAAVASAEPRNLDARAYLADAHRRLNRPDSAVALARDVLARNPRHGFAHYVLGATLDPIKGGAPGAHPDSALAHYRAAANASPPEPDGWIGVWLYASVAGDTAQCRAAMTELSRTGFFTPASRAWGQWLLESLPPNAVLLTNGDMDTFPAQGVQAAGIRPDVLVVNFSLLNMPDYARSLARLYGLPLPEPVTSGAADATHGAWQTPDGKIEYASNAIVQLWKREAIAGRLGRPLYAAVTIPDPAIVRVDAALTNLVGPAYRLGAPDSTADYQALTAAVRSLDPAQFGGHVAAGVDRSPIRRAHSDMLPVNLAASAGHLADRALMRGDKDVARLALEKIEGLRRTAAIGDTLESLLTSLRGRLGAAAL